jgi:NADH:ubiquinone oxidoreductase subunit 3 (subunit A)
VTSDAGIQLRTIRVRSSEALVLAVVAAILVVAAVVLYSLVARKMYAKDKQLAKRHQEAGAPEQKPGKSG